MIIIITGATHSGKTYCAQNLMQKYNIPYLFQDHIKMGLIRSGYASVTPDSTDIEITEFLWPVIREIIKTAIENKQNLIIEGCYVPFTWREDFEDEYLKEIKYICLCFSEKYISEHYSEIMKHESCIESRIDDGYCTMELLKREHARFREGCESNNLSYILIDTDYEKAIESIVKYPFLCKGLI